MRRHFTLAILLAIAARVQAAIAVPEEDARIAKAKELFESYVRLEHAFDPALADLYSDEAQIRNHRRYPTGEVRKLTIPAPEYKKLLRRAMPLAKARGDISTYSQVTYAVEADGVRIQASRTSKLKNYTSLLSLLVKPTASGAWRVFEELSESRP